MGVIRETLLGELGCITPKLGIVVVVTDDDGKVLILKRADDSSWCFPCGWVDIGEGVESAAIREVWEETGLIIAVNGMIGAMSKGPEQYENVDCHQVNIILQSQPVEIGRSIRLSHEHVEFAWIELPKDLDWHSGHEVINVFMTMKDPAIFCRRIEDAG